MMIAVCGTPATVTVVGDLMRVTVTHPVTHDEHGVESRLSGAWLAQPFEAARWLCAAIERNWRAQK